MGARADPDRGRRGAWPMTDTHASRTTQSAPPPPGRAAPLPPLGRFLARAAVITAGHGGRFLLRSGARPGHRPPLRGGRRQRRVPGRLDRARDWPSTLLIEDAMALPPGARFQPRPGPRAARPRDATASPHPAPWAWSPATLPRLARGARAAGRRADARRAAARPRARARAWPTPHWPSPAPG